MRRLSTTQWSMVGLVTVLLVGAFVVLGLRGAGDPAEDAQDVEPTHQTSEPVGTQAPTSRPADAESTPAASPLPA